MTTFDDREKALENRFFRDQELEFKVVAKRRKFLGMWAAERMHKTEEETLKYALDIVRLGIEDSSEGAVVNRILADMQAAGLNITEAEVREKMDDLEMKARKQIAEEYGAK
ncbi:MAG: DUF1476 domain-containing protein [Hyphomicrobiales bacterium]|nr:DUF1476 domain-containing protein [Rickettsiales bacterium]MCP5361321.1 DUF1476 domain-containing protein [Hyphomicrobiales bacterium]